MTENEAIQKHIKECETRINVINEWCTSNEDADRDECKDLRAKIEILKKIFPLLQNDSVRPTWNLNNFKEFCDSLKNMVEVFGVYSEIGTLEECAEAVYKQKPILVETEEDREYVDFTCPNCKTILQQKIKGAKTLILHTFGYCYECGQKLDWSEAQ